MKQETLEEVFNIIDDEKCRYSTDEDEFWNHYKIGVIDGLKWQKERSYSEEKIRQILIDITLVNPKHLSMLRSGYGEFPDSYELTENGVDYIIEQLKKK